MKVSNNPHSGLLVCIRIHGIEYIGFVTYMVKNEDRKWFLEIEHKKPFLLRKQNIKKKMENEFSAITLVT